MKNLTLRRLATVTHGRIFNGDELLDIEISSVFTDSRKVRNDCLFSCIKGEHFDGHDFAAFAVENGAIAAVSEKELPNFPGAYLLVDSTFEATKEIAEYYRMNLETTFIGVTGSVGKTSTKEFIAAVLSKRYRVHKTQGNLNNEWGVPFTIFDIKEGIEVAVIEMGINHFGEMDRLAKMVRPDIVVMTNIGQSHLEHFGDRDGILRAKAEIFRYLAPDGVVILNGDDDKLSRISLVKGIEPQFFGLGKDCDVCAEKIVAKGLEGSEFDIVMRSGGARMALRVDMPVPGRKMIYNALAAYLVGTNLGVSPLMMKEAIENMTSMVGRNNIVRTEKYTILDDCYNASPSSMESSIDILKMAEGRKVAILGDMLELGEETDKYHYQVGRYAAEAGCDQIICIGPLSEKIFMGAKMNTDNKVDYFHSPDACIRELPSLLKPGDTILVKASHSMNFETIVEYLKKEEMDESLSETVSGEDNGEGEKPSGM